MENYDSPTLCTSTDIHEAISFSIISIQKVDNWLSNGMQYIIYPERKTDPYYMKESTAIKAVATGTLEKCRDVHSPQLLVSEVTSEAPIKVAQSLTLLK